jgi:hypothetical protein
MSNKDSFLHQPEGETVCFTANDNGTVEVTYQRTLDPNEELDSDTFTTEEARDFWRRLRAKGYREATYWHQCKRDWSENRD